MAHFNFATNVLREDSYASTEATRFTSDIIHNSETSVAHNAPVKRQKIVGYNVNGVKQPTVFCPLERLVSLWLLT